MRTLSGFQMTTYNVTTNIQNKPKNPDAASSV